MKWTIAKARARFSELLRKAGSAPQPIYKREKLVAAVINARALKDYQAWQSHASRRSVEDAFQDLRKLINGEGYTLEVPPRVSRENAFTRALDELPR